MPVASDSQSTNARGGTELIKNALVEKLDPALLDQFQIYFSRVEEPFDQTRYRIFYAHDLAGDPAAEVLRNGGWRNFHLLIFVSNWQMQEYIKEYNIPWTMCQVVLNAIEPIEAHEKPKNGPLRLAYWSTPHRGLNILVPVFERLAENYDVELDVYSSYNLYGWGQQDAPYEALFDQCRNHPKINYYGTVDNQTIRQNLKNTHIMAYPSIWQETSCICLMEAMSAGLLCVHPNYGALAETAANWTTMYQWQDDLNFHAGMFHMNLEKAIAHYNNPVIQSNLKTQSLYASMFYSWDARIQDWTELLTSLAQLNLPRTIAQETFTYRT